MESTFWGVEVKPGKETSYVPPPVDAKLHLSQATLSMDAKAGEKVGLTCKVGENSHEELLLCTLREGASESQSLDLIFDHYTEFTVRGNASVHLTGYYIPDYDEEETSDEDEEEDDDEDLMDLTPEEAAALAQYQRSRRRPSKITFGGDEEDDEIEDEDEEDEDESDEEDESEDEEMEAGIGNNNHVTIVELNEDGTEKGATDEEEEDEDEDEDEDEEDEDEEEEDDDEEEELEAAAGEGPMVIEVTAGGDESADMSKKAAIAAEKRKAAALADQDAAAGNKKMKMDQGAAAKESSGQQEPATGKKAKKGKSADGASVLNTWHPGPMQEEEEEKAEKEDKKKKKGNESKSPAVQKKTIFPEKSDVPISQGMPIKNGRPNIKKFDNGFIIEDTHMGPSDGKVAKPGQKVLVRYRGTLAKSGKVFDETKGRSTFNFRLGVGEVIKGWDRGVVGMRAGDKRRLTVPPQMAYGSSGVRGAIPPNATLIFDVELVDVKGKAQS